MICTYRLMNASSRDGLICVFRDIRIGEYFLLASSTYFKVTSGYCYWRKTSPTQYEVYRNRFTEGLVHKDLDRNSKLSLKIIDPSREIYR